MSVKLVTARDYAVEESRNGLSSYLHKVKMGSQLDIRTPFWNEAPRNEIAKQWGEILYATCQYDEIITLEAKNETKIGPISVQLPYSQRKDDIASYFTKVNTNIDKPALERAIRRVKNKFTRSNVLRPLNLENAADLMQSSTNSGIPYFRKRKTVREYDLAIARSRNYHAIPAILGWRGQASGTEIPKQRVVWMFPQSVNIVEMSYFQPMFDAMKETFREVAAWKSMDAVDTAITEMIRYHEGMIFSIDFSGYDQTIQAELREAALQVMLYAFQKQYHKDLSELFYLSGEIPLLCPDELWFGQHGEPSGSNFTNMRDTIVNIIANYYVAERSGLNLSPLTQFQGDDGVVAFDGYIEVEALTAMYAELGLKANATKQLVSLNEVSYLQRLHFAKYIKDGLNPGVYPTMRALNSLVGMERFHQDWDEKMFVIRAIMILENCKHHPQFTKFIDFVVEGDKFQLGMKLPGGISSIFKSLDKAKTIPGFVSTYNSPKLTGIRELSLIHI